MARVTEIFKSSTSSPTIKNNSEVKEEVGVDIRNPCYFGSQPWPFPNSLVMAFSAEWAGGDVVPDGTELEEARWFSIDALPDLPEAVHISRQLIDDTLAQLRQGC